MGEEIYSEIDFTECERLKEILWERRDIHLYQIYERTHNYYGGKIPEMNFENFYRFFIQVALEYAGNGELRRLLVIDEERKRVISDNILAGIANIPVRCLIEDIGKCREEKKLSGKNEREEYESYEEHFLKRPSYIKMLCRNYPEMLRLLLLRISQILAEIQRICKMLKEKNSSIQINDIKMGLSDSHTRGETAAKILLDNERWVIYKSRSLQKDRIYQNIYGWFCGKLKLSSREREILSNRECGIDAYIEQKPCVREEEIKRYFYRLGIQLFICYLSGTSDLHRENIIADGEYPELIDLETMPGAGKDSVMETGMLPVSCWGNTPIGLPVISNPKTSNIKLDYRQREVSAQDNILLCNGRWMAEEICIGFEDAYRTALGEREAINMLFEPLYREKSRYLFRHTQQYSMYLETSFSPYFMKDTINRILLLHVLKKKKTEDKQYRRVFAYEIEAMMDMEIPVYHFNGKSTYLKDGHGAKYGSFFVQSAYEDFQKKVDMLSFTDLKRQQMLIRLSAECGLPYGDENRYISTDFVKRDNDCEAEKNVLLRIIRHILDIQPKCDGKYMWTCLKFSGKDFRIEQAGMNLYDGVPGMAVLFASVLAVCRTGEYERVYRDLIEEMFHYTDGYTKEKGKNTLCGTGMFEGEGSIVFAYIILYRITGKKVFLQYARKHAGIVQKICRQDSRYDLISGNSGWIVVLLQLFRLTGEEQYLSFAVEAGGEILWDERTESEKICGWLCASEKLPLSGMAHGNSGGILAYGQLLRNTGNKTYIDRIVRLLNYENSLFSEECGAWEDIRRQKMKGSKSDSWCHGGSGILLSRISLLKLDDFREDEDVRRDIERGFACLMRWRNEGDSCICHGIAGKYMILEICARALGRKELREESLKAKKWLLELEQVPVWEYYHASVMSGIGGIGLVLCWNLLERN